ncbi:hypothetical protein CTA2_10840 [Colletotrichum tanaceti]|uniref:Uncharacterized protein n=1 Tax=Colletotrichum tanaceti TaxID=1306861 RepID=A0A4U6X9H5_9PEZI|nr:hypothetical protein CTA2_10840 [Colletotrichum tanaceti]TKW52268.1 hypothetical protein CTA1_11012 [Colletotrichum tanaceti]
MVDLQTGKRDADLDLKADEGRGASSELVKGADVLVDGNRSGALKQLGFDSATLRERCPNLSLTCMRENCYGFRGPVSSARTVLRRPTAGASSEGPPSSSYATTMASTCSLGKPTRLGGRFVPISLFTHPVYFWDMSGKEYGLDRNIKVLAPASRLSSTTLACDVPTGRRGRSKPIWVS